MKHTAYREQDYAFGQRMLTLRAVIGLTQAGLAEALAVSRRSVADWEAGGKYPKVEHLKLFIELAVKQQAFHVHNFIVGERQNKVLTPRIEQAESKRVVIPRAKQWVCLKIL